MNCIFIGIVWIVFCVLNAVIFAFIDNDDEDFTGAFLLCLLCLFGPVVFVVLLLVVVFNVAVKIKERTVDK